MTGESRKPDIVQEVSRYHLWLIPEFPVDVAMVRPRERALPWRIGLLESIRDEGLRHPILIYGHSPKGTFNHARWGEANKERDQRMYIAFGTNRYWAIKQLGWDTFPAILSWNQGSKPPFEGKRIAPAEFKQYAPAGRVFVQEHGFGWKPYQMPEQEFACPTDA